MSEIARIDTDAKLLADGETLSPEHEIAAEPAPRWPSRLRSPLECQPRADEFLDLDPRTKQPGEEDAAARRSFTRGAEQPRNIRA